MSVPASAEFIALCESQVTLLRQALEIAWCGVYLTEEWAEDLPNLLPIVVYPETGRRSPIPITNPQRLLASALPTTKPPFVEVNPQAETATESWREGHQVVLPIAAQEKVMGILVAGRQQRQWNEQEFAQIEQVAKTLGIACQLDRRPAWYRQQLQQHLDTQRRYRDRFDTLLHQFRNPMTAIRTFSKLLRKRLLPEDRNYKISESLIRESDRLQSLLEQFDESLDGMTVETDVLPDSALPLFAASGDPATPTLSLIPGKILNLQALSIPNILAPLIATAEAIASERHLEFHAEIPADLPPIQGDAIALNEVLSNLIDNALKYTPKGGSIILRAGLQRPQQLGIAITDTGPGIPPTDQARIFERHYRGIQAQGNISGTGLGLAIAQDLIEQMQGEIELISPTHLGEANRELNSGTTFIIWLPTTQSITPQPVAGF
ncbi:MAG: GAF domain-containing sensor histidine kinase [Jaaginema sp. PMC 1079.18]|nr:GAF domain-containing sensor histidine kinase [Jaaginema sp. PMC 1080.18]MEC4851403.1 GAF domain-containing sensor histidine kinase [Jaaginema sp. PMC 1079.18]MEC4868218.1 GAF domain-containing sensor histidine kinase [Jaaginema sp. PMC 1078.18]